MVQWPYRQMKMNQVGSPPRVNLTANSCANCIFAGTYRVAQIKIPQQKKVDIFITGKDFWFWITFSGLKKEKVIYI